MSSPSVPSSNPGHGNNSHQGQETYTRTLTLSVRPVHDPNSHANHQTSSSLQTVRVTLTYPCGAGAGTIGAINREIHLRLTNDADPLFYYHLRITDAEYAGLKQHQGLLVDFNGFPTQLIGLLDKCGDDKFQLVLNCGGNYTVLDIVESNPFKYLSHLSLAIVPGSDADLKKYLSALTIELKSEIQSLNTKYHHVHSTAEIEIGKLKAELKAKEVELGNRREEMRAELGNHSEKYFRELNNEKEKFLRYQTELGNKWEAERLEIEKRNRETISKLESKIQTLESDKRSADQSNFHQAAKIKDLETKLKNSSEDLRHITEEVKYLQRNNTKLDSDYHEKQRLFGNLVSKSNLLEQEVKDKAEQIARGQDIITDLNEKIGLLESKNKGLCGEVDELKAKYGNLSSELGKGNEIIRKLQEDGRQLGKKVKLQAQIIASQESQINEKTATLVSLTQEFKNTKEKLAKSEEEFKELSQKFQDAQNLLGTNAADLEAKENQICYLNKQLAEVQGLSNLNKFRETLNLNKSAGAGGTTGTGAVRRNPENLGLSSRMELSEMPSWMNIYHSTAGAERNGNSSVNPGPGAGAPTDAKDKESTPPPPAAAAASEGKGTKKTQRAPTWARSSNKATLDSILNKPSWKKS